MEPFAGASEVWAHEYRYTINGIHGTTLMLAGAVGEFVVVVVASGQSWDWPSVSDLAALQARRLREEAIRSPCGRTGASPELLHHSA